jgi:hypothetical protein
MADDNVPVQVDAATWILRILSGRKSVALTERACITVFAEIPSTAARLRLRRYENPADTAAHQSARQIDRYCDRPADYFARHRRVAGMDVRRAGESSLTRREPTTSPSDTRAEVRHMTVVELPLLTQARASPPP